jgi:hypothetical protein
MTSDRTKIYGTMSFLFSAPVNGFSFLMRQLNYQFHTNISLVLTVTTLTANVTYAVDAQLTPDINFIGWFQPNSTVVSVSIFPLTYRWSSTAMHNAQISLDDFRVYSACAVTQQPTLQPSFGSLYMART